MAASTRSSSTPRRRSWRSTMRRRRSSGCTGVRRRLDAEVREDGRGDVDDARDLGLAPDLEHRDDRIAGSERAVAAAACMVPPAEVGELDARRGRDDQLARVRVMERRPRTREGVGVVGSKSLVAAGLPAVAVAYEAEFLPGTPQHGFAALEEQHRLGDLAAVQTRREVRWLGVAAG